MSIIHSKKIVVHTGNTLENEELVRTVGKTTLEELRACIKTTLNNWQNEDQIENDESVNIRGVWNRPPHLETLDGLKTTVKVFLSKNSVDDINDAVQTLLRELRMVNINLVIIVPPDVSDDLSLEAIMPVWQALESAIDRGIISNLGIADVTPQLFKQLYKWAKVKPTVMQVNLSYCCSISEELVEFAKFNDVQVLTHHDDEEVIDDDLIGTITSRVGLTGFPSEVCWVATHRSIETCYGLVSAKGYTVSLLVSK